MAFCTARPAGDAGQLGNRPRLSGGGDGITDGAAEVAIAKSSRRRLGVNSVGHALRNQAPPLALRNFDRRRRVSAHARGRVARRLAVEEGQRLRVDVAGRVQVAGVLKPSQRRLGSWPENAIDGARVIAEVVQLLLDVTHLLGVRQ